VAQRVKTVADGTHKGSTNIYILSDLAQGTIRRWAEKQEWGMESWPGKINLPAAIFAAPESKDKAAKIFGHLFISADVVDVIESEVVKALRAGKAKRKAMGESEGSKSHKRPRKSTGDATSAKAAAPKAKKAKSEKKKTAWESKKEDSLASSERRRSGRQSRMVNYRENEEEDVNMEGDAQAGAEDDSSEMNGKSKIVPISSDHSSDDDEE
jgi:sister-chromatid-cohesion protein PDS5